MKPTNLLVICSDEHNKRFLGCYGHEMVQTPNLDRLAAMGTRFTSAYTPSPICMPARAALATGRYPHQTTWWDNGTPYTGEGAESWGHRLNSQGFEANTFGKLHFHPDSDHGYDVNLPLWAKSAESAYIGAIASWMGEHQPIMDGLRKEVLSAEIGEFGYTRYDRATAEAAAEWIANRQPTDKPWCSYVSFTYPHYPFMAPADYVALYDPADVPLPVNWEQENWDKHPAIQWKRERMGLDGGFSEAEVRQAIAVYFGMITFMDAQVGRVLDALAASPYADNTRILYTSDHGDMMGEHGMWFKGTMHEGSAGIPMILAGPGVPAGHVCTTPVNLIDVYPTAVESVGAAYTEADDALTGRSLIAIANEPNSDRATFSEYHSVATTTGNFMLRTASYKYIEYIGYEPQLYDMVNDPEETNDLAADPANAELVAVHAARMREQFSPEEVDARVRSFQNAQLERLGGVDALLEKWPTRRPFTPAPEGFR